MTEPADAAVRRAALDPTRSFIVQAPAGSGKTELLIQRHLRLLGQVRYPEQVVAVTFTRKAAAEMRSRVLEMLRLAQQAGAADVAPHKRLSFELASRVLERDTELGWGLLDRPGRLRIETVDALNGWLADRLPIASGGLAGAAIIDSPDAIYRRAAEDTLLRALTDPTLREHAAVLLRAADNSLERLIAAAAAVLPTRDQWLGIVAGLDPESTAAALEKGLQMLASSRIDALRGVAEPATEREAFSLAGCDLSVGERGGDSAPGSEDELGGLVAGWQQVAGMLLTKAGTWRRRFTRNEGFPPDDKDRKRRVSELVAALETQPRIRELLVEIRDLPALDPDPTLVTRVVAARSLLLNAVAELKVTFEQVQAVDFLELALGAQTALGAVDAPSELLLALDRRIEHLLVDEFQDTSHSQFRLLERLTSGWTEGDGRTLFLVGDPMQSIYRFRDADMSLFLRAKSEGFGHVRLEHLVLTSNFRSAPTVVDWVNSTFSGFFPDSDDPASGRAAYYPFAAVRTDLAGGGVELHRTATGDLSDQHAIVARLAAEALAATPDGSVAVLVQSRSHLRGLRSALDARGIPVRAVELDTLAESEAVQDLIGLTRALLHPGDRIAWLALLRAPWCGLSWAELHAICAGEPTQSVRELIETGVAAERLADSEAKSRLEFVRRRLERGFDLRGRFALPQWIECCWQLLDGPATLRAPVELERARQFFRVLSSLTADGDIPDTTELARALEVPFSPGEAESGSPGRALEIMTIHRAKGLEFDTVILFGLDKRTRATDAKLLYWQQLPQQEATMACLLATMSVDGDPLTRFLQRAERELDRAERARLLYVAVTRARRQLHLIGHVADKGDAEAKASADTLMSWLVSQFAGIEPAMAAVPMAAEESTWIVPELTALEPGDDVPMGPLAMEPSGAPVERKDYEWASLTAAHVGTVVHRALKNASARQPAQAGITVVPVDRLRAELRLLGVPGAELDSAAARAAEILQQVLEDERGRWILDSHADAQSELELTVFREGALSHLQIDRTFVDETGVRWIIDYKTSRHAGGALTSFIEAEVERYRPQLETYAAAMQQLDPRPIRVGLYFPVLGEFRDWVPAVCAAD